MARCSARSRRSGHMPATVRLTSDRNVPRSEAPDRRHTRRTWRTQGLYDPRVEFNHLSDVEFAEGLARMRSDADAELEPVAV